VTTAPMPPAVAAARPPRRWLRVAAIVAVALLGLLLAQVPPPPQLDPAAHSRTKHAQELRQRFDQAVALLHAKRYEDAAGALQRVLELAPAMPEAHVNMGFAMLGLQRTGEAAAAFQKAIGLRSTQANAYYGLSMAYEQAGDLEMALGSMRSYLHLSKKDDGYHAKARAALWEWEQHLGRHPPSPPGSTTPREPGGERSFFPGQ
jgi:tetratricopeptide (TPR) repeat protein